MTTSGRQKFKQLWWGASPKTTPGDGWPKRETKPRRPKVRCVPTLSPCPCGYPEVGPLVAPRQPSHHLLMNELVSPRPKGIQTGAHLYFSQTSSRTGPRFKVDFFDMAYHYQEMRPMDVPTVTTSRGLCLDVSGMAVGRSSAP